MQLSNNGFAKYSTVLQTLYSYCKIAGTAGLRLFTVGERPVGYYINQYVTKCEHIDTTRDMAQIYNTIMQHGDLVSNCGLILMQTEYDGRLIHLLKPKIIIALYDVTYCPNYLETFISDLHEYDHESYEAVYSVYTTGKNMSKYTLERYLLVMMIRDTDIDQNIIPRGELNPNCLSDSDFNAIRDANVAIYDLSRGHLPSNIDQVSAGLSMVGIADPSTVTTSIVHAWTFNHTGNFEEIVSGCTYAIRCTCTNINSMQVSAAFSNLKSALESKFCLKQALRIELVFQPATDRSIVTMESNNPKFVAVLIGPSISAPHAEKTNHGDIMYSTKPDLTYYNDNTEDNVVLCVYVCSLVVNPHVNRVTRY